MALKLNPCNQAVVTQKLDLNCEANAATYYVFSSPPQPVWGRPKYRNNVPRPRGIHDYYNIMWDPRVRRGDPLRKSQQNKQMEKCLKSKKTFRTKRDRRPATPPPVDGREHCQLQTENYWESLEDESTTCEVRTQTLALHELPIAPWFTPSKLGEDKATEILPGDLFNFDCEIQPVLETVVGRVVEQALLECMEEEELLALKDQQMLFEERRRLEQLRLERLKEREHRMFEEKERLMREMQQRHLNEEDAETRVAAGVFSALYLTGMGKGVVKMLRSEGYLNSMQIIASQFLPWLNCQVEAELSRESLSRSILDDMLRFVTIKRETEYEGSTNWYPPPTTPVGEITGEGDM